MKNHSTRSRRSRRFDAGFTDAGFTLVELLVVIAIIAILAAMLLPVLAHVKLVAYKKQTRIQVNDIATAIQAYDSAYGRFPISPPRRRRLPASEAGGDIHLLRQLFHECRRIVSTTTRFRLAPQGVISTLRMPTPMAMPT